MLRLMIIYIKKMIKPQFEDGKCDVQCQPGYSLFDAEAGCQRFDPCRAVKRRPGYVLEPVRGNPDICGSRCAKGYRRLGNTCKLA